jgi:acetyltransferase-like isoleucine patch superfamily enzyme
MSAVDSVKQAYWSLLHELRDWRNHALYHVPGRLGVAWRRRHLRSRLQACGSDAVVAQHVRFQSPDHLQLGDRVTIECGCYLNASGGLTIESDCYIGPETKIWTDNHVFADPSQPFIEQGATYKPVVIERDVWVGARSFIKPGTIVKTGAVIRPGTVLARSVPPFAIVQGNPGAVVGWRKPRA